MEVIIGWGSSGEGNEKMLVKAYRLSQSFLLIILIQGKEEEEEEETRFYHFPHIVFIVL